jgi:lysozyme
MISGVYVKSNIVKKRDLTSKEGGIQMQSRNPSNSQGMDISRYQDNPDYNRISADRKIMFSAIKASQSIDIVDDKLMSNYANSKKIKLPLSLYHFAEVTNDPEAEARHYLDSIEGLMPDLWYILDVENGSLNNKSFTRAEISDWSKHWLSIVEKERHEIPMIYTGASFAGTYFTKDMSRYPLWVAHFGATTPMANGIWDRWTCFQYTDTGHVGGISSGYVDLDEYDGNIDDCVAEKIQMRNGDAPMNAAEKQAFDQLEQTVKDQATVIETLKKATENIAPPDWAKEAADFYAPHMTKPQVGSYDFWRISVVQFRKATGVIIK